MEDLHDEKVESVNGPEFDVLGGIFKTFKLKEWELEFARQFLADPFNCDVIGNIKRYGSNILDDWVNKDDRNLDWINHLETFLFWWSYTQSTDFKTFVCAVNFEQYHIADKCDRFLDPACFTWPRTKLKEISNIPKYLSYIDSDWLNLERSYGSLTQFPMDVTLVIISRHYTDTYFKFWGMQFDVEEFLTRKIMPLIPVLKIKDQVVSYKKMLLQHIPVLIEYGIKIRYTLAQVRNLTDSELELILSTNHELPVKDVDIIYRLETIKRNMINENRITVITDIKAKPNPKPRRNNSDEDSDEYIVEEDT